MSRKWKLSDLNCCRVRIKINGLRNLAWFRIKVTVLQIRKTTETQRHRGNMGRKKGQDRRRIVVFSLVRVYSFPYSSDPISPCLSASVVVFFACKKVLP